MTSVDNSGREEKALAAWNKQVAAWDRMQNNIARRFNKRPDETLQASVHHQRMRQEELGILDAAVPSDVRSGNNAWEMSLRNGNGGVRYVQIGKAYPYPLYCPIKDSDCVTADNNALMRVIPMSSVQQRNKPTSESQYFHSRHAEFRKFVKKRFAHFLPDQEGMVITGSQPPRADKPIDEDDTAEGVVLIPREPLDEAMKNNNAPTTQYVTEEPKSRPLSAVMTPPIPSLTSAVPTGPMLCFSASHLNLTSAPQESVQGTIVVDNIGTTAVYYSIVPVSPEPLGGGLTPSVPDCFVFSDVPSGVLLPEDQKLLTFTLRSNTPGIFAAQYEILTIPAGKERIMINLRGVVLSNELSDVATNRLNKELNAQAIRDYQRTMITEALMNPENDLLDRANIELELKSLAAAKAKQQAEILGVSEHQETLWTDHNRALHIPYNKNVYSRIALLYRNFHTFLASVQHPNQPVPLIREWDGSVKALLEDLSSLKDPISRGTFLAALKALLRAASCSQDRDEPVHVLLLRSAGQHALGCAADDIHRYASVAKDLAEGKCAKQRVEKVVDAKSSKPAPKAAKAPAKPAAVVAEVKPQEPSSSDAARPPHFERFFYQGVYRIVSDAIEDIFTQHETFDAVIASVTDRPFELSVKTRLDQVIAIQALPDPEIDLLPEQNAKGKGKK